MRGSKVKKLRKLYRTWIDAILPHIPKDAHPISFRTFRKRVCARQ